MPQWIITMGVVKTDKQVTLFKIQTKLSVRQNDNKGDCQRSCIEISKASSEDLNQNLSSLEEILRFQCNSCKHKICFQICK